MIVLAYLLVPIIIVAIAASITWIRNRQPTSLQSGVDSFRREMDALSPEAAPMHRRRTDPQAQGPVNPPGQERVERPAEPPAATRRPPRSATPPASPRAPGAGRSGPPRRPPTSDRP